MARYVLLKPVVGAPPGQGYQVYPRGTTIADSQANAQANDVLWPALTNSPSPVNMAPLDGLGAAAMPGSSITTVATLAAWGGSA